MTLVWFHKEDRRCTIDVIALKNGLVGAVAPPPPNSHILNFDRMFYSNGVFPMGGEGCGPNP